LADQAKREKHSATTVLCLY